MDLLWIRLRSAVYGAVAGAALMLFAMWAAFRKEPEKKP